MSEMQKLPYGDQGDGTYRNPVLFADYSDPDVVRVGEDYYLTASSFNCSPGLPILHSRDLVNWNLIGHALDRFPFPDYDRPQHGKGVWAPAMRFHDGRFWIVFGAPDEGIFLTTAERPEGPWSPLHCMRAGRGLIDPCPFWDDDGTAWLVRAQAGSRCHGVNSLLTLHRMEPDGSALRDDGEIVVDGRDAHPTVEGPKLYKRNGFYYIFAPVGGVRGGWQTVFRSKSIRGPYEHRVVLLQGNSSINGPHQGAWVDTPFDEDWFLHFQDRGAYGRILHLQPVSWENDWPVMGEATRGRDVREPVLRHAKPRTAAEVGLTRPPSSDDFEGPELGLQWQWMANANPAWGGVEDGALRLATQGTPGGKAHWFEAGNLLLQKPQDPAFQVTTCLQLRSKAPGDHAGLILTGGTSAALYLEATGDGYRMVRSTLDDPTSAAMRVESQKDFPRPEVCLRAEMRRGVITFSISAEGSDFAEFGPAVYPKNAAWMGAKVGLFALNRGFAASGGSATFTFFHYESLLD